MENSSKQDKIQRLKRIILYSKFSSLLKTLKYIDKVWNYLHSFNANLIIKIYKQIKLTIK